jgi:hypothetical protein
MGGRSSYAGSGGSFFGGFFLPSGGRIGGFLLGGSFLSALSKTLGGIQPFLLSFTAQSASRHGTLYPTNNFSAQVSSSIAPFVRPCGRHAPERIFGFSGIRLLQQHDAAGTRRKSRRAG